MGMASAKEDMLMILMIGTGEGKRERGREWRGESGEWRGEWRGRGNPVARSSVRAGRGYHSGAGLFTC
jgi:hypothetical protein